MRILSLYAQYRESAVAYYDCAICTAPMDWCRLQQISSNAFIEARRGMYKNSQVQAAVDGLHARGGDEVPRGKPVLGGSALAS